MTACTVCGAELVHGPTGAWKHEGFPDSWLDHPPSPPPAPPDHGWYCACGFERPDLAKFSATWQRAHRDRHLECFPELDLRSRANLDAIVAWAEQHELDPSTPHPDLPIGES